MSSSSLVTNNFGRLFLDILNSSKFEIILFSTKDTNISQLMFCAVLKDSLNFA